MVRIVNNTIVIVCPTAASQPASQRHKGREKTPVLHLSLILSGSDMSDDDGAVAVCEHEATVGITAYVSVTKPFTGALKQRFTDFQVNEVDLDGRVANLVDLSVPPEMLVNQDGATNESATEGAAGTPSLSPEEARAAFEKELASLIDTDTASKVIQWANSLTSKYSRAATPFFFPPPPPPPPPPRHGQRFFSSFPFTPFPLSSSVQAQKRRGISISLHQWRRALAGKCTDSSRERRTD